MRPFLRFFSILITVFLCKSSCAISCKSLIGIDTWFVHLPSAYEKAMSGTSEWNPGPDGIFPTGQGCANTTFFWISPVPIQSQGGSNSFSAPQIHVKIPIRNYGLFVCCYTSSEVTLTNQTQWSDDVGSMATTVTLNSSLKVSSERDAICCDNGKKAGFHGMYISDHRKTSNYGSGCAIPDWTKTDGFNNGDSCQDCSCDDVKELSDAYGCNQTKTLSVLCNKGITPPSICVEASVTVLGSKYDSISLGCFPVPLSPSPPEMCKCSVPSSPSSLFAYPICSSLKPASIYSPQSTSATNNYSNNNCAPPFIDPTNSSAQGMQSTFEQPAARVLVANTQPVNGWGQNQNNNNFSYCQGDLSNPYFKKICAGNQCGRDSDCIYTTGSQTPYNKPLYKNTNQTSGGTLAYPVEYLYSNSSKPVIPSGPSNIAFYNNPKGSTVIHKYGVNNAEFGDISFDFTQISNDSNCVLKKIGNASDRSCPGSKVLQLTSYSENTNSSSANQANNAKTRYIRSYLPDNCGSGNASKCTSFCVAEVYPENESLPPYSLGCFDRPKQTGFSVKKCDPSKNLNPDCQKYANQKYTSNNGWCIDVQAGESDPQRICGENTLDSIKYPDGGNNTDYQAILTNTKFQQPARSSSLFFCESGEDPYSGDSCNSGLHIYSKKDGRGKVINNYTGSSVICAKGFTSLPKCPEGCVQDSQCTSSSNKSGCDKDTLTKLGCNCILAKADYNNSKHKPGGSDISPLPTSRVKPPSPLSSATSYSLDPKTAAGGAYKQDSFISLAPWDMIPSDETPASGEGLRGRNEMEMGLCIPSTPWDPIDCCQAFGPQSDFVKNLTEVIKKAKSAAQEVVNTAGSRSSSQATVTTGPASPTNSSSSAPMMNYPISGSLGGQDAQAPEAAPETPPAINMPSTGAVQEPVVRRPSASQTANNSVATQESVSKISQQFYEACQAFTCGIVTKDEQALKDSVSSATTNDAFYISQLGAKIYESCVSGQQPTLYPPDFFASNPNLKNYYNNIYTELNKLTSKYGNSILCSFFQPGANSQTQNSAGAAQCKSGETLITGTKSKSTCGGFTVTVTPSGMTSSVQAKFGYCQDNSKFKSQPLTKIKGLNPSKPIDISGFCGVSYSSCKVNNTCPTME